MGIPDRPKSLIAKTFRFPEETLQKLALIKKAGKEVNEWVRELLEKSIDEELAQDKNLFAKVQEIHEAESTSET
jgi:predicted DNA-binding protein